MTGSSFSVATTVFVSLAICAVISYGIFYYFKQRLSLIEKSQMEQARIMQAIISRGLHAQPHHHHLSDPEQAQQAQQAQAPIHSYDKEITITQNSLIEVSSESESESESESDSSSETSNTETEEDKWSIGDEIHQPESYHKEFEEDFKKNILLDTINIDRSFAVDSITIDAVKDASTKKIISLNIPECTNNDDNDDDDNDDDDNDDNDDDDSSTSSSSDDAANESNEAHESNETNETNEANNANEDINGSELKIGYKSNAAKSMHLNYGNMSVPALRQLAKERGLGGEDADLQKLKKKDLVQLLQWNHLKNESY